MKIQHLGVILPFIMAVAGASLSAEARTRVFSSEPEAVEACGLDEVVWVDLDKGQFYGKNQYHYSKGKNGVFACMKTVQDQYRQGHG